LFVQIDINHLLIFDYKSSFKFTVTLHAMSLWRGRTNSIKWQVTIDLYRWTTYEFMWLLNTLVSTTTCWLRLQWQLISHIMCGEEGIEW